jgi:preprotein translocase subunit SecE
MEEKNTKQISNQKNKTILVSFIFFVFYIISFVSFYFSSDDELSKIWWVTIFLGLILGYFAYKFIPNIKKNTYFIFLLLYGFIGFISLIQLLISLIGGFRGA